MLLPIDDNTIRWRLHLASDINTVYETLASDEGRERFWVERSHEDDSVIDVEFISGEKLQMRLLDAQPPSRIEFSYFDDSRVIFELEDSDDGCDVTLTEVLPPGIDPSQNVAGWVSVLLALKAVVDHNVDLRNHDPERSWQQGFVDN